MASRTLEEVKEEIIQQYKKMTPKSRELFEEAQKWLPGGGTRNITYFYPYPFYVTKGEGCYLEDVDGNRYIDVQNNMTVLLHGHAHPKITEALHKQASSGTAHNAPVPAQYELAKILCNRVPSIEEIRFCNSGTEATMFAIRAARVFTKKEGIILTDGCYHGSHDYVEVNFDADLTNEGMPEPQVEKGVPEAILEDIYVVPFNDLKATEKIMKKHHKEIAAMIVEPLMGYAGGILATPEYLKGLRELTKKYNILLIFDEVITFRLSTGGMQKITGVIPDLTALGKTIGGGLPVGAFGGKREIMEQFNPIKKDFVMHSGTFSGNALTMAAGKAALELYNEKEIKRLDKLGNKLREGLQEIMDSLDVKCYIGGIQSICYIQFPDTIARNKKEITYNTIPYLELSKYLRMAMAINGLYGISKGVIGFMLSTAMDEEVIDEVLARFRKTMEMVLPIYEDIKPFQGFAGIIYTMLKPLNSNEQFKKEYSNDNYSLLLVAKDDSNAIKLKIKNGKITFTPIKNTTEKISQNKKECQGVIITTRPTFLALGLGKVKPWKAILSGRLKVRGIKYIQKFTNYFSLLRKD
ncbi:MAG: aminotransferase class III-fold pyridoxal phosphate-dependent enzyme [Candidatus Heimdallarchaeota archaeon]|nr:aminotransferase class III-fold pyridoxal phosphate-dependent enzyme [Candidatus Heimdallarchaeota archaeon]